MIKTTKTLVTAVLAAALFTGCNPMTNREAGEQTSEAMCRRLVTCNMLRAGELDWCVSHAMDGFCSTTDCNAAAAYPEKVDPCADAMSAMSCTSIDTGITVDGAIPIPAACR